MAFTIDATKIRSDARGAIVGLSRYNTNAHLARATLESICYQSRDVVDAMEADSGVHLEVLKVDGGVTANALHPGMDSLLEFPGKLAQQLVVFDQFDFAIRRDFVAQLAEGIVVGRDGGSRVSQPRAVEPSIRHQRKEDPR